MKKVFIYVRVSTQEQANEGYSIGEQTERLQKYCEIMGWIVVKVYTDAGHSGATIDRPALKEMLRNVKAGKADAVLVYKLDRLSRSQKDTLTLIEDSFLANNTDFISVSENFDTSTPLGRAMIGILAVFAQLEREQIKERMIMGKDARAKQGKFHGSKYVPIGYDYIDGELVTNEFEKIQIKQIFEMYASGKSPNTIAKTLKDAGYTHKHGKWKRLAVSEILSKKTYLGYVAHKGEWHKGTHEAFIDEELFNKVQSIKEKKGIEYGKHNRRAGRANSYLGGYLECKCCHAKYSRVTKYNMVQNEKRQYTYYMCNSRSRNSATLIKDRNCKNQTWKMDNLDSLVFSEIKKLALDPNYMSDIKEQSIDNEQIGIIETEISKIDDQISKLMDLYSIGTLPIDVLQDKVNNLNDQKSRLENELDNINAENKFALSHEETLEIVQSFNDVLKKGDFHEIRAVIGTLIEKIEIDGYDITIHWNFA